MDVERDMCQVPPTTTVLSVLTMMAGDDGYDEGGRERSEQRGAVTSEKWTAPLAAAAWHP